MIGELVQEDRVARDWLGAHAEETPVRGGRGAVRVPDGEAADRFLQTAAPEEGEDLRRLAFDRALDRRVVQDGDEPFRAQPRQCGFELQRFVDGLAESSGALVEVLRRMADHFERFAQVQAKFRSSYNARHNCAAACDLKRLREHMFKL